jgi:hypothetical protein
MVVEISTVHRAQSVRYLLREEAVNSNAVNIGLIRPGIEPTILLE